MTDPFQDALVGDEQIYVVASGPGHAEGVVNVWWQVALTQYRVLVARFDAHGPGGAWNLTERMALQRSQVHLGQYPRTPTSQARVELSGFPKPVVLLDVDRPDLNPAVQTLVGWWGQPISGVPTIAPREPETTLNEGGNPETKKLLWLAAACLGILVLCCGCSSLIVALRALAAQLAM